MLSVHTNRRTHLAFSPLVSEPNVLPLGQIKFGKNNLPVSTIASAALPVSVRQRSITLEYPDSDSKVNIADVTFSTLSVQKTKGPCPSATPSASSARLLLPEVTFKHLCRCSPSPHSHHEPVLLISNLWRCFACEANDHGNWPPVFGSLYAKVPTHSAEHLSLAASTKRPR